MQHLYHLGRLVEIKYFNVGNGFTVLIKELYKKQGLHLSLKMYVVASGTFFTTYIQ